MQYALMCEAISRDYPTHLMPHPLIIGVHCTTCDMHERWPMVY